jgi:predicted ATPase
LINRLRLRNFKALKDVELILKPITILSGKNGSGKSSVFHALGVLKESSNSQSAVELNLPFIDLGSYRDIIGDANKCTIEIGGKRTYRSVSDRLTSVDYSCNLTFDINGMLSYESELKSDELKIEKFTNSYHKSRGGGLVPTKIIVNDLEFTLQAVNQVGWVFSVGPYRTLKEGIVLSDHDREEIAAAQKSMNDLGMIIYSMLENVHIVPVIRGLVEPYYTLLDRTPAATHKASLRDIGDNFSSKLAYNKKLQKKISDLAEKITNVRIEVELLAGHRLGLRNTLKDINMVNEGFGSNQLLFVLESLVSANRESLIGIEEPEIHLHPTAQWELSNVICDIAKTENKQIVISTHSEHIIYAILARIAKKAGLTNEDVALYNFEIDSDTNQSTISPLEINEEGKIAGGLKGFIEADLKALDAYIST